MSAILNLFCGIGGNRELWGDTHNITSVELDPLIAEVYAKRYPNDIVIIGDALQYVTEHYKEFDFIWASPPCPSHGQYRHNVGVLGKGFAPLIPEMTSLYGLITFLKTYFKGYYCVENTIPYYTPVIEPTVRLGRHLVWANFPISDFKVAPSGIRDKNNLGSFALSGLVSESKIKNKRQVLRNCVDGLMAEHILNELMVVV